MLILNGAFCSQGGKLSRGVNWEGVNFYNSLINNLLSNGKILNLPLILDSLSNILLFMWFEF